MGRNNGEFDETEQLRNTRWTRKALLLFAATGFCAFLVFALAYSGNPATFARLLGTGVLIGGAAFLLGVLLGFLFGIPRTLQQEKPTSADRASSSPSPTDKKARSRYDVNTNLEQISDWLTKILVGVGLTQLNEIPRFLKTVAAYLVDRSQTSPGDRALTESVVLVLVVFFLVNGFLSGYLMTRLFLAGAFSVADDRLYQAEENLDNLVNLDFGLGRLTQGEKEVLRKVINEEPMVLGTDFVRESNYHNNLRSLKEKFLIRLPHGGSFQQGRTVELTPIGRQLKPQIEAVLKDAGSAPRRAETPSIKKATAPRPRSRRSAETA